MCTLRDSTNINTIIEFVPNCSMSTVMVSMAVLIRTFSSEIFREEEEHNPDPLRNPIERNHMGLLLENEVAVVKTPTIISNNPV